MFERTLQFILVVLALVGASILALVYSPGASFLGIIDSWSVIESLAFPILFAVATAWLWRFLIQPPKSTLSKRKSLAAAFIVAASAHALLLRIAGVVFYVLGFEFGLGGGRSDGLAMGIGLYLFPLSVATFLGMLAYHKLRSLRPLNCCATCGYDLTGNVFGVCPECGEQRV